MKIPKWLRRVGGVVRDVLLRPGAIPPVPGTLPPPVPWNPDAGPYPDRPVDGWPKSDAPPDSVHIPKDGI